MKAVAAIKSLIASDADRSALDKVLVRQLDPVYTALGAPRSGESYSRQLLRSELMEVLGDAQDPKALAEAKQLTDRAYASGSRLDRGLDPVLTDTAIMVTAQSGDTALYEKIFAASKDSNDPGQRMDALRTLARFHEPALVTRTLDYVVSGQVRNQDSWIPISILLAARDTREQTWTYLRQNWDKVHAQFTTNSGSRVVATAGTFCSTEKRDEVAKFFATHKVDASERTLAKALDNINDCVRLREAQEPSLHEWLAAQAR
jgi:aminopeptidase N